jgi:hypothetical protein
MVGYSKPHLFLYEGLWRAIIRVTRYDGLPFIKAAFGFTPQSAFESLLMPGTLQTEVQVDLPDHLRTIRKDF